MFWVAVLLFTSDFIENSAVAMDEATLLLRDIRGGGGGSPVLLGFMVVARKSDSMGHGCSASKAAVCTIRV